MDPKKSLKEISFIDLFELNAVYTERETMKRFAFTLLFRDGSDAYVSVKVRASKT